MQVLCKTANGTTQNYVFVKYVLNLISPQKVSVKQFMMAAGTTHYLFTKHIDVYITVT